MLTVTIHQYPRSQRKTHLSKLVARAAKGEPRGKPGPRIRFVIACVKALGMKPPSAGSVRYVLRGRSKAAEAAGIAAQITGRHPARARK